MVSQRTLTMFLILGVSLIVGCEKKEPEERKPHAMRAAYHYVVAVNADSSGICTSTVTGGPYSDPNWVDLSYNNMDDVKYIFSFPSSVYFPTNTKNTLLPGTPFFQGGFPISSIAGGATSPASSLTGNEGQFFYFQYAAILKNDGTPYCSGPKEGMGIHVTQ